MEWKVWLQEDTKQVSFGQKRGTLTVEPGNVVFESGDVTIPLDRIKSVGRQRMAMWAQWVAVEYELEGETRKAYFGDRKLLGWSGAFGGNTKMEQALRAAASSQPGSPA